MGSFGDKLKREREMRGVTLDEISESTKIARRHLEALESEDFASLPGGVFNKGFVRAYARFIGINEDQAVADYSQAHKEEERPEEQFPLEIHEKPDRELNPRNSQVPLIGSVMALLLLVAGFTVWRGKKHQTESVVPSAAAASRTEAPEQQPTSKTRRAEQSSAAATETASAPKMMAVDQKVPVPEPPNGAMAAVTPAKKEPQAERMALTPKNSFFVIIKAKEDAWISVVADGRRVSHGMLRADKQRFVRAGKQIILTTGNAGGIDVSFNGKPLGAIGNESEARTIFFTPSGATQQ
jgi:cytoskeleton protein RodZ